MTEKQAFEIPQQLRQLAEMNIEQARTAYGQFMDAMAQAMSAWSSASANAMTSGFQAVQERSIQFAKENAEAGFALASELAKAKNLQDVLRLQSSFAQKQMESYARQAQELGRLLAVGRVARPTIGFGRCYPLAARRTNMGSRRGGPQCTAQREPIWSSRGKLLVSAAGLLP